MVIIFVVLVAAKWQVDNIWLTRSNSSLLIDRCHTVTSYLTTHWLCLDRMCSVVTGTDKATFYFPSSPQCCRFMATVMKLPFEGPLNHIKSHFILLYIVVYGSFTLRKRHWGSRMVDNKMAPVLKALLVPQKLVWSETGLLLTGFFQYGNETQTAAKLKFNYKINL